MQDDGLSEAEASARFFAVDRHGLLVEGGPDIQPGQRSFVRTKAEIADWHLGGAQELGLLEVVRNAKATVLIGVSSQPGAFSEKVVRTMAQNAERPVIFPLSNPTSLSEAKPQDILDWSEGRALIGTGSPFTPVKVHGREVRINQTNNSYVFPGLALGIIASRAREVSNGMIKAAALTLAALSPTRTDKQATLLPPLPEIRSISLEIAKAVGKQAMEDDLAGVDLASFEKELAANMWTPAYEGCEPC